MSVAVTSFPVPLSPVTSTVLSLWLITRRNSNTAFIRALRPTTSDSGATGICDVMIASRHLQGVELRYLCADGRLDAVVQRHVRRGTAGTHPDEATRRRPAVNGDQLD